MISLPLATQRTTVHMSSDRYSEWRRMNRLVYNVTLMGNLCKAEYVVLTALKMSGQSSLLVRRAVLQAETTVSEKPCGLYLPRTCLPVYTVLGTGRWQ